MKTDYLIKRTTTKGIDEVCERVAEVAQKYKFGVIGLHNLKEKMASKGVEFDRECRIFEVCNPQQAKDILSLSMEIATALPCRISVYQDAGQTVLATIKPTVLIGLFDKPGAAQAAKSVEDTLTKIIEESI